MGGLQGNIGWVMAQKETTHGVLPVVANPGVAAGAWKTALSGGGMGIARSIGQLAETDSSRDQGISFTSSISAAGSPEFYVRDDNIGFWLWSAFGADAVTGSTNFTHTITPSNSLPYIGVWRDVGDSLYESFKDCKTSSITIAGSAGQPLTATVSVVGGQPHRFTTDPSIIGAGPATVGLSNGYAYNMNDATISLSGGVTALISSFSLTIDNNINVQQSDAAVIYDVVAGQRQVSCDFDLIFETLDEYNAFHYGSTTGVSPGTAIYTTPLNFQFDNGVNNSIRFYMPQIAYTDFPVNVNPNGDPVTVAVKSVAQRNSSPIITATVKNQVAVY